MMKEKIIIRKAKREDFCEIHKIVMQVHQLHVQERGDIYKDVDCLSIESFIEELANDCNIYLVAEFKNQIIGICFSEIKEISNNKIMKNRKILHINNICVDENNRRNGIGKKLYKKTMEIAKEMDVDAIELMVWGFNENAINFYKNLGMNIKNVRFEQKIE